MSCTACRHHPGPAVRRRILGHGVFWHSYQACYVNRFASPNEPRLLTTIALVALVFALQSVPVAAESPDSRWHGRPHDLHLTYSRIVVDGDRVTCRVRLFKDDLQRALKSVAIDSLTDSLFTAYFNARVVLTSAGATLKARVTASGRDSDTTDPEMWWFRLEAVAPQPLATLSLRLGLLFELYADQRNLVTVIKMPGEERRSLYFTASDRREQQIRW